MTFKQDKKAMSQACSVTVEWLEQCLALQTRTPEISPGQNIQVFGAAKPEVCNSECYSMPAICSKHSKDTVDAESVHKAAGSLAI